MFTYTGTGLGTDVVVASAEEIFTSTAYKEWTPQQNPIPEFLTMDSRL